MKDFQGKTAVITGGASGIGYAMAEAFGAEGMSLVLGDIEEARLADACAALAEKDIRAVPVTTDVSQAGDVERLAAAAQREFGDIHVVCNNAGVVHGGSLWDANIHDYEWVMGVNLWGVIHGVRTFVPILKAQECESHIVNTSSISALVTLAYGGIYYFTKAAVLSLSETLFHELSFEAPHVKVSALCPEYVQTRIDSARRNRPAGFSNSLNQEQSDAEEAIMEQLQELVRDEQATPPSEIAVRVLQAIRDERLYVLPEEGDAFLNRAKSRFADIAARRNPQFDPPAPGRE